jgi:hypothetical protein
MMAAQGRSEYEYLLRLSLFFISYKSEIIPERFEALAREWHFRPCSHLSASAKWSAARAAWIKIIQNYCLEARITDLR